MSALHRMYALLAKFWRRRRYQLFVARLRPGPVTAVLDVGGYWWNWAESASALGRVVCLNVVLPAPPAPASLPNVVHQVGDGCALPFANAAFDIAYSNSVIEHVGSFDRQQAFAAEIRRVGRAVWVQTPAFECPIEPHFLTVGFHWLPSPLARLLQRYVSPRAWIEGPASAEINTLIANTRLLSQREFRQLFPDCDILTERLLGVFPKSYIAVRAQ